MKRWEAKAREDARAILQSALTSVLPQVVVRETLHWDGKTLTYPGGSLDFSRFAAVRVASVGKAAGGLAAQAAMWGGFKEALLATNSLADVPGFTCYRTSHPVPNAESVKAGTHLRALAEATGPDDLLLLFVSGGASAIVEAPAVPLLDVQRTTHLLQRAGADVHDLNCIRKHLSHIKGGQLAAASRGTVLALLVSDVIGDDPAVIGSGLTAPDPTTFGDALDVLERHHLNEVVPPSVLRHLQAGAAGEAPETPKPGSPAFERVTNVILANNARAVEAAAKQAVTLGYRTYLGATPLSGEARDTGASLAEWARQARKTHPPETFPLALIAGGETTVTVSGNGKGGRNQEVALGAVEHLSSQRALLAAMGTDGIDGPTDAAGAIVDGLTLARAHAAGLDVEESLLDNDAYTFFESLDDLIRTGPTGTNVMDIAIVLVGAPDAHAGR